MALAEAASVVTTLKSAAEIVEKIRSGDSKDDLRAAGGALAEMLISARLAALDLIEQKAMLLDERSTLNQRVKDLENELRGLTDFNGQSGRYVRVEVARGKFVYRESTPSSGTGGVPDLCPKCFEEKKVSSLHAWGEGSHHCYGCKSTFYF